MSNILIIYSSTDGQTLKICKRIESVLQQNDEVATLLSIDETNGLDLNVFDKIVLGSSVRYGKHSKKIQNFININAQTLTSKPNAFFSVNLVARKPEKAASKTNPYLNKFLSKISWQPNLLEVFAGKVDYPQYRYLDRIVIQLIMWMTKGPTDPKTTIEYTNWDQVDKFGNAISQM